MGRPGAQPVIAAMTRFPANQALFVHSFTTDRPHPPPKHDGDFWPHDLLGAIRRVIDEPCPLPNRPTFVFEPTAAVATANLRLIEKHGMDRAEAIEGQAGSPLSYGSKFRPTSTLKQVFGLHPNWPRTKKLLKKGSDWPLDEVSMGDREADLNEALALEITRGPSPSLSSSASSLSRTSFTATPCPSHCQLSQRCPAPSWRP